MTIQEGTKLFNIYGLDNPEEKGGKWTLLGELVTTSEMTTSKFGDEKLFFRH